MQTELIDGFLPIGPAEAAPLDEQRAGYEAWRSGLPTDAESLPAPLTPVRQALAVSNAAILATQDRAMLARGDLAPGKDDES